MSICPYVHVLDPACRADVVSLHQYSHNWQMSLSTSCSREIQRFRFSTRHSAARLEIILLTWDLSNPADLIPRIASASASRSRTLSCLYDKNTIPETARVHCWGQRLGAGDCCLMAREHILLLIPKQSAEAALPFRSIGLRSGRGIYGAPRGLWK
ncbi:hypothetical protein BDV09DRAFT_169211 [Aspergillus tetrazonus]